MAINDIVIAAKAVGITAIITNSNEKIETQLNRLQRVEDLPVMLISWDIETTITFDENGFLNNPSANIVCLLMTKSEDTTKTEMQNSSEEMGLLFVKFIRGLNDILKLKQRVQPTDAVTSISYKLLPDHGAGKHSGVLGKFTMSTGIENC